MPVGKRWCGAMLIGAGLMLFGASINTGKKGQASQWWPLVSSWSCPSRLQEVPHRKRVFLSFCPS